MKQLGTVKRHKPTGALVWFPNEGKTGIVVEDCQPWKAGMDYAHWNVSDLEETDYQCESHIVRKTK